MNEAYLALLGNFETDNFPSASTMFRRNAEIYDSPHQPRCREFAVFLA